MDKKTVLSPHKRYWLISTLFLLVAAAILTWFMEYRHFLNDFGAAGNFIVSRSQVFLFTSLLMFLLLAVLTGITRRPIVAVGIMWSIVIVVTYIHIKKYIMRGTPLLPEDFMLADQAASLTNFVGIGSILRMILALGIIVTLTVFADRWATKKFKLKEYRQAKHWWKRHAVTSRLVLVVLASVCFWSLTDFVRNNSGARQEEIAWLDSRFTAWNQTTNYYDNGFLLGFLYNLQKLKLKQPEGYSEEKMAEIKEQYNNLAEEENAKKISLEDEDINLVIILNESFYDTDVEYNGVKLTDYYPYEGEGEMLPNLRKIQSNYPNGYMYSLDYGGGTANIEFEALTGLSNYWANAVPYTSLVPKAGEIISTVRYLKENGYNTRAIHPYNGGMYKRDISLPNLGFEEFLTELDMTYTDREGHSNYINDASSYKQVIDLLKSTEAERQIITLITMQNHSPYGTNYDAEELEFESLTEELSDERKQELANYYESLHKSDEYLGDFIDALDELDKKVVVLFFGDHASGPFDLINGNEDKNLNTLSRMTPYFIYNNFGYEKDSNDGDGTNKLAMTTPNCLANTMFNYFDWQKPDYFYLLDQVCTENPILTQNWFGGNQAPFRTTELSSYELLNYDILGGEKYWMK